MYAVGVGDTPGVYATAEEAAAAAGAGTPTRVPLIRACSTAEAAEAFVAKFAHPDTRVVYTDGACVANGKPNCVASIGVFWGVDDPRNQSAIVDKPLPHSNNIGELHAILNVLEHLAAHDDTGPDVTPVRIVTDSKYALESVTVNYDGFVRRGWRTTAGTEVKNQFEIRTIRAHLQRMPHVQLVHVRGHCNIVGNTHADRLATEALVEVRREAAAAKKTAPAPRRRAHVRTPEPAAPAEAKESELRGAEKVSRKRSRDESL